MFKDRMKKVAKETISWAIVIGICALIYWGIISLPDNVNFVIGAIMFTLLLIGLIWMVIYYICKFIKWLFIEPYREHKKSKGDNTYA